MALFGTENLGSDMYIVDKLTSDNGIKKLASMINGCSYKLDIRERNLSPLIWEEPVIIEALSNVMTKKDFKLRLAFHKADEKEEALETLLLRNTKLKNFLNKNSQKIERGFIKLFHWREGFLGVHSIIGDDDYCVITETHKPNRTSNGTDDRDTCSTAAFTYFDSREIKIHRDLYENAIGQKNGGKNIYDLPDVMVEYEKDILLKFIHSL